MSKRKNTKKTTKKLNKKSGIKNKPNPNKPYNININIDNSKKSGSRTQTQGGIKQTQGNPYPVYSKAVPMGGSTIVNNIPPPLQPQSNFNQQELTNIKKEILDRLNQPLTTPLLTHDPSFNTFTDNLSIRMENIERNLLSSTPKLENQTEIKPQPQLQDNKNNNLMEDSYRKLKEKTADEFFNFSYDPNTKTTTAEPNIDKLAELPSEYFDIIVKKRKGKI